jgi:hypothetical protein
MAASLSGEPSIAQHCSGTGEAAGCRRAAAALPTADPAKVAREAGVSGAWVARPQQVASSGLPTLRRRPLDGLIASFVLSVVTAGVLGSQG